MEYFDLVNRKNTIIGTALRTDCHGNPELLHRAVHVMVVNDKEELLLQKRSASKDVQPLKWDTSVGGHLLPGETYLKASVRETREELGVTFTSPLFMYEYLLENSFESEFIQSYLQFHNGPFDHCPEEIIELKFWEIEEIKTTDKSIFTTNFLQELNAFLEWRASNSDEYRNYKQACFKEG